MGEFAVVIGYGPVGRTVVEQLLGGGRRVRVITRSGAGPDAGDAVENVRGDAAQPSSLAGLFDGASAVFDCMHGGKYTPANWWSVLPAADRNVRDEAGRAGAVVVYPESLYAYAPPHGPITEDSPRVPATEMGRVRAQLIDDRLASATPTVSVAASDFFGPHVHTSHAGERMLDAVLRGRTLRVVGDPDVPHSFTYIGDLAAAMVAAADRPDLWNQVLHAPTGPAVTQREMARRYADAAGVPVPEVGAMPRWALRATGVFLPEVRSLSAMAYQFERPFVLDSSRSEAQLRLAATPFDEAVRTTVQWWRGLSASRGDSAA